MVKCLLISPLKLELHLTQFFASGFSRAKFYLAMTRQDETELGTVMGLIRKVFVVGGALLAMPSPPQTSQTGSAAASTSWSYFSAAADTVSDFKGFCDRKPQVCVTAQYLAGSLEGKAKYGAKLIYEWASDSSSQAPKPGGNLAKADQIKTSATGPQLATASTSTLRIEDLVPEWHGTLQPEKG
jgi:Family of unknown function (DUF5330)